MRIPLLLSVLLVFFGSAFALQNVTTCPVITASDTYVMQNDLSGAPNSAFPPVGGAVCVKIGAPNVVFDCNGFLITNNGTANITYGIMLNASATNVTVTNCPGVSQYTSGVLLTDSSFNTFTDVVSHSNVPAGGGSGSGFLLTGQASGSHGNIFDGVAAYNNSDYGVFSLVGSSNNTYLASNFSDNGADGVRIQGGSGSVLVGNIADGNVDDGFLVGGTGNLLVGNNASGNVNGIFLSASSGSALLWNNAILNQNNGIELSLSTGTLVLGNIVSNNTFRGMELSAASNGNNITGNTAVFNGDNGIEIDGSDSNSITGNTAAVNGGDGFELINADGNSLDGNQADSNQGSGFFLSSSSGNLVSGNNATFNLGRGLLLSSSSFNDVTGNLFNNNSNTGVQASFSTDNNFLGNIVANNTFGGFTIAQGSNDSVIAANLVFLTTDAFSLSLSSSRNLVANNTAHGNSGAGFRAVSAAANNTFQNNLAFLNDAGFEVLSAHGNNLTNNTAHSNSGAGIAVGGSTTSVSSHHLYNNTVDFALSGNLFSLAMDGVVFDNPLGDFVNYTNLSISDAIPVSGGSYDIRWAAQPAPLPTVEHSSFAGKFVEMTDLGGAAIDSVTWNWLDSELVNYTEGSFLLMKYNGTWFPVNTTPDTAGNTLSLSNVTSFSTFGILQLTFQEGSDDGGGAGEGDPLSATVNSTVDGNVVTVTSDGSPVEGANVLVDGLSVGLTNSSGQVSFPGCSDTVIVKAKKDGYQDAELTATLVTCPACTTNDDCPVTAQCTENQCVPVPCACGTVQNHSCVAFACCADTDCPSGQACVGNSCVDQFECTSDSGCAGTQFCDIPAGAVGGSCEDVQTGACGQVTNHTFIPYGYECGTEPGCPSCPSGQSCLDHKCVAAAGDLSCPSTGVVGSQASCIVTDCSSCPYEAVLPDGNKITGVTDQSGKITLPLNLEGTYKVTLLRDGQLIKTIEIKSLPKTTPGEEQPPTAAGGLDAGTVIFLLILLALVIAGILYWRGRQKK